MGHSFCGNAGQYFWMGASRSSLPCSHRCIAAVAVIGLETEARRESVSGVTGTVFSRSAITHTADQARFPSNTTATDTPGAAVVDMNFETADSIRVRRSGARLSWAVVSPAPS